MEILLRFLFGAKSSPHGIRLHRSRLEGNMILIIEEHHLSLWEPLSHILCHSCDLRRANLQTSILNIRKLGMTKALKDQMNLKT